MTHPAAAFRSRSRAVSKRVVALAVIAFACFWATADIIYRETFGIPPTATADLFATNFDWQRFDNNGTNITTGGSSAGVNYSVVGRPADVANVNAGPNADGTFVAYTNGILYFGNTFSPSIGFTTEFQFNPANYVAGSIVFSWYEGNNTTPHTFRLLVRVGGAWYASTNVFTTAAVALASFGTAAELKSLTYDPSPTKWLSVNFNGNYVVGATPGTGTTINSTAGALSLGANPGSALSGSITAFGVYGDNGSGGTGNRRIDTFTISATPVSTAPVITVDLTNKIAELCTSAAFFLNATGTAPLNYFWFANNAPAGGNSNSLVLNNLSLANAGNYFVVVSNSVGTVTSSIVSLTLLDTTAPNISQCATNQAVAAGTNCLGTIPNLTNQIVAADCSGIASITQSPTAGTVLGTGPHLVTFTVTDYSNNVAQCSATISIVGSGAPTIISCVTNQYLNTDPNQQLALPDITSQVTATNPCGAVAVTQSPAPGTIIGPGTTLLTFTATSGTNNATCAANAYVNARPVAANQSLTNGMDTPVNLALGGSDADGGSLTFYIVSAPAYGSLGTLSSNLVIYNPDEGFTGTDSFTFSVSDGAATSALATVSITFTNTEILYPSGPQIRKDGAAVMLADYATMPLSGRGGSLTNFGSNVDFANQLARVNFLRSEPANAPLAATRFFVCDNNRNLYILNKSNKTFTSYINFQAVFPKFDNDPGYAGGLVAFQFDPGYATNGIFYTAHTEDPAIAGSGTPTNSNLPGLDLSGGYTTTTVFNPPVGSSPRQSVLVEWTDTNVNNGTFEGTAREIIRVGFNSNIHPMGDLAYNPLAQPGDSDWRNLYIACGDGGAGESASTRTVPQRLDAVQGKILRLTPDITLRPADELGSSGRYRIPTTGADPNPFVSVSLSGLKKEIYAYGFRNCHRLSWDAISNKLLEDDIGLHSWEEVNIIHKGFNYGYSEREGTEQLFVGGANNGKTGSQIVPAVPFPTNDTLTVTGLVAAVTPTYPVAEYSHADGDAIASGFVYRGTLMPQLYGKYIFGEITTGRLLYADLAEMIAKDDGVRTTVADVHEIQIVYDHPNDNPNVGTNRWRMFDIESVTYTNRGGLPGTQKLPGSANATTGSDIEGKPYGRGRADIRMALGGDGELYVLSKSDGMIRQLVGALHPPKIQTITQSGGNVTLTWNSVPGWTNRVQFKTNLADAAWTDVAGDVIAPGLMASKTNAAAGDQRYYRVRVLVP